MKLLLKLAMILGISGVASIGCFGVRAEALSFTDPNVTKPGAIPAVAWERPTWLDNASETHFPDTGNGPIAEFYNPSCGCIQSIFQPTMPIGNPGNPATPPSLPVSSLLGRYDGLIYHVHNGYYTQDGSFSFIVLKNGTYFAKIAVEDQIYYTQGTMPGDHLWVTLQRSNRATLGLELVFVPQAKNSVTCTGVLSNGLGFLQLSGQRAR